MKDGRLHSILIFLFFIFSLYLLGGGVGLGGLFSISILFLLCCACGCVDVPYIECLSKYATSYFYSSLGLDGYIVGYDVSSLCLSVDIVCLEGDG